MSNKYKYDDVDGMEKAIIASVQNDDKNALSELLINQHEFWGRRSFDDFAIKAFGEHMIGLCLEHDAQNCAKYLVKANLPGHDLNASGPDGSGIEPAISKALACHANEVVAMLLDNPGVKANDEFDDVTPLERAIINHNYEGAETLIKARPILHPDVSPFGLSYHQVKATELSVFGNHEPIDFVVKHSPDNMVLPSAALTAVFSDEKGSAALLDRFFEMNLNKALLFETTAKLTPHWMDVDMARPLLAKCLEHGADVSFNNYAGLVNLAESGWPGLISSLCDKDTLNANNGAVLKAAINNLNYTAFETLVEAGANPDLLENRVASYITNPEKITGEQLSEISRMQEAVDSFCNKPASAPSVMTP